MCNAFVQDYALGMPSVFPSASRLVLHLQRSAEQRPTIIKLSLLLSDPQRTGH